MTDWLTDNLESRDASASKNLQRKSFQSLAVTNGHHDSKEDMDMKDDNNQEVTQDKCLT